MAKRKAKELSVAEEPRRSSRRISTKEEVEPEKGSEPTPVPTTSKKAKKVTKSEKKEQEVKSEEHDKNEDSKPTKAAKPTAAKPSKAKAKPKLTDTTPTGRQYWLLKAEPESRIEKGKDIKFSIDDLAAKSEPEPWDGIRNFAARNNLRAMKKGDLAFFYHSSCKIPAIVGTMEIVEEHTPDLSAHDPSAPYYDPKSSPSDPKWSVVHVKFKQKLENPITLKEMKEWFVEKDNPLGGMQMLKMTRMSVSKVSQEEWNFLVGEMEKKGDVVEQ